MIKDEFGNRRFFGIYRGIVKDVSDPLTRNRVRVQVPQVLGDAVTGWAWPIEKPGAERFTPPVNEGIWIMFEGGDPSFPVWIGTFTDLYVAPVPNYGAFSDYADQWAGGATSFETALADTAAPMRFNQTDEANGISVVDGEGLKSKITFANAGVYNLQWSGQFENADNFIHSVSVWLRKGGVGSVVGSNGIITLPARKSAGVFMQVIAGWNFVFSVEAGDYYEFMWSADSTHVSIQTLPVSTVPTRPSTAGVILTVVEVK